MRDGNPSVACVMQKFQQRGVDKIVVLPLYPQYAGATTASTFDAVSKELQKWRYIPSIYFLNTYHYNPLYIQALADTVKGYMASHCKKQLFREWGDPYYDYCLETTLLVKAVLLESDLGFTDDEIIMTFQSRFGKPNGLNHKQI